MSYVDRRQHAGQRLQNLALALDLIENDGVPVFPVASSGSKKKQPLSKHGFRDATVDTDQVRQWFRDHPSAFVAYPTSASTTVVLDVDGPQGLASLAKICAWLEIENDADLTPVRVRSQTGGLHCHFRLREGEVFRGRAGDIMPGIDTRGVKEDGAPASYIIAGGNRTAQGIVYQHIGESADIRDAAYVPKRFLYLATFNRAERDEIKRTPELREAIRDGSPADWSALYKEYKAKRFAEIMRRAPPAEGDAIRRQAVADLDAAGRKFAALTDGRRSGLFCIACGCAKYVAHGALSEAEFRDTFAAAADANGSHRDHGTAWLRTTLRNAIAAGRNDALPPIASRFRIEGASA